MKGVGEGRQVAASPSGWVTEGTQRRLWQWDSPFLPKHRSCRVQEEFQLLIPEHHFALEQTLLVAPVAATTET